MSFEAKYIGPKLADLFDPTPAKKAAKRMADSGGDRLHSLTRAYTPIDTGELYRSWYRMPAVAEGDRYVSRVRTEVEYAPHVNYGTGLWGPKHTKYLIEPHPPKRFLSWVDKATGKRVYARRVWHPGSEGAFMLEKAAADVEAALGLILAGDLELFKREMEAQAVQAQVRL